MKEPFIELMDYNALLSLISYFENSFEGKTIHSKPMTVVQSYSDISADFIVPSMSVEILYTKNRSIGFGDYYGEIDNNTEIIEIEGTIMEYRVQLNVYSNTRGENLKWSSLLNDILKNGEDGIPLNTYNDNGTIKDSNIGKIKYHFSSDIKNNPMNPNIKTYTFHNIFEIKMVSLQQYRISYSPAEIGTIIGDNN